MRYLTRLRRGESWVEGGLLREDRWERGLGFEEGVLVEFEVVDVTGGVRTWVCDFEVDDDGCGCGDDVGDGMDGSRCGIGETILIPLSLSLSLAVTDPALLLYPDDPA